MAAVPLPDGCPCSNVVIMQLFHELKQQFPAVPDRVVSECIQNCHDKSACEALLRRENHAYLMHSYPIALKMSTPGGGDDTDRAPCDGCASTRLRNELFQNNNNSGVFSGDPRCVNPSGVTGTQWCAHGSTTQYLPSPESGPTDGDDFSPFQYESTTKSHFVTHLDDNCNNASRLSVLSSTTYHKHCARPCSLNVTPAPAPAPAPAENNLNEPRVRSALHVEPAPHYACRNYWGGGGGTLAVSPTQQPRSYTSVNLTLRPPSLEPLPPIEIASAGTSLTYSTSTYDPRQGFQSQLQIRIGPGGVGSVSALRTRAPDAVDVSPADVSTLSLRSNDDAQLDAQLVALGGDQLQGITRALVKQQLERKNRLRRELHRERQKLRAMQRDVQEMTEDLERRQLRQRAANIALPVVTTVLQKVQSLRQEITLLQMECKKMTTAVDMTSEDQGMEERSVQPPPSPLDVDGPNWTCTECTFRNHPLLDKCEQCEMPRIVLGTHPHPTPCYCHMPPNKRVDNPLTPLPTMMPSLRTAQQLQQ